jgi:hypothetical protein
VVILVKVNTSVVVILVKVNTSVVVILVKVNTSVVVILVKGAGVIYKLLFLRGVIFTEFTYCQTHTHHHNPAIIFTCELLFQIKHLPSLLQ